MTCQLKNTGGRRTTILGICSLRLFHCTTVALTSSMLQPDMLPLVRAFVRPCCSRTCCRLFEHVAARQVATGPVQACCRRTWCRLFEHVAAGHVAACSSMLQPDMLPLVRACCSRTSCHRACSSILQPDMLPPVQAGCSRKCSRLFKHVEAGHVAAACCSLIRTCCSRDGILSSLFRTTWPCAAQDHGRQKMHKCRNLYKKF